MKEFVLRNKVKLILLVVAIVLISYGVVTTINRQTMTISIDRGNVSYIVIYYGISPRRVNYAEHQVALDSVFDMLTGDYEYSGTWRRPETTGGGPYSISFFNHNRELINRICYMDYRVFISANPGAADNGKRMYTYRHKERNIDLSDFYSYMDENDIAWISYIG